MAAILSRDLTGAMAVANRMESGIRHIDGPTVGDMPEMPFGGVKGSGCGRFDGRAAIHELTDNRWVRNDDPHQHGIF